MWKKPLILKYTNTICDRSKEILQHFSDPPKLAVRIPPQTEVQQLMLSPEAQGISALSRVQQAENKILHPTWKGSLLKKKKKSLVNAQRKKMFDPFLRSVEYCWLGNLNRISKWLNHNTYTLCTSKCTWLRGEKNPAPTSLAELWCATAFSRETHDGDHLCTDAGASLFAATTNSAHCCVRLAAVILLQCVHVPTDAGALSHVLSWGANLSALHFGCKDTVSQWMDKQCKESKKGKTEKDRFQMEGFGRLEGITS